MIEYTVKVYDDGHKVWLLDGKRHREDGPACEFSDGSKLWYRNGLLHRVDGPAVECANGTKFWYLNGFLHRVDGPAIEYPDGRKFWYFDGKELTEEKFNKKMKKHTITIDGKNIDISEESYQKMKDSLTS